MSAFTFSLADICRAKTIPVEIKDDQGNVEGVVYLKEPSALAAIELREKMTEDKAKSDSEGKKISEAVGNAQFTFDILALVLSDVEGNPLVNSSVDRKKLEAMPPRILVALRDPAMEMIIGKQEIQVGGEDIDRTLANLDDQIAATYQSESELAGETDETIVAVPIDGNENLHLDQDPGDGSASTAVDPSNPFVETVPAPS